MTPALALPHRTTRLSRTTRLIRPAVAVATALTAAGLALGAAAPALAAPANAAGASVTVTSDAGDAAAFDSGPTTLHLTGTGFQAVQGGFGGIYVMFGWVANGAWQPSAGGTSGSSYAYMPDAQDATNAGFMKFVAFAGSSTAGEANGGTLAPDGTWSTDLNVPGPVVPVGDASGATREVDCRVETCGVITIGAHGVKNAANETFTPITFTAGQADAPVAAPTTSTEPSASAEPSTAPSAPTASPDVSHAGEPTESAVATPFALDPSPTVTGLAVSDEAAQSAQPSAGPSAGVWVAVGVGAAAILGTGGYVLWRRKTHPDR